MATLLNRFQHYWRGRTDLGRVRRDIADFRRIEEAIARWMTRLEPEWRDYTTNVSSPDMAVSLETAGLLGALCEVRKPARILDLGSGFSSFVLRTAAAENGNAFVKSVDDDDAWLVKTRHYLRGRKVSFDAVGGLETLTEKDWNSYDLVFHDIGAVVSVRAQLLPMALECARPNTASVVLDDCHKTRYAPVVEAEVNRRGLPCYSLHALGCDRFHRFAMLVSGNGAAQAQSIPAPQRQAKVA